MSQFLVKLTYVARHNSYEVHLEILQSSNRNVKLTFELPSLSKVELVWYAAILWSFCCLQMKICKCRMRHLIRFCTVCLQFVLINRKIPPNNPCHIDKSGKYRSTIWIFYWPFQGGDSFVDHLCYFCLVFVILSCTSVCDALWSPAGKGLISWLSCVMSYCDVVTSSLVSWVRCEAWLYWFLIFALFLTLNCL